jgi:hypothetical protein
MNLERNLNINDIAWPIFEDHDRFTPCQPSKGGVHVISRSGWYVPRAILRRSNSGPVNEDIESGRIRTFSSMDDLIDELDSPN